jgi:hypothetical protein
MPGRFLGAFTGTGSGLAKGHRPFRDRCPGPGNTLPGAQQKSRPTRRDTESSHNYQIQELSQKPRWIR